MGGGTSRAGTHARFRFLLPAQNSARRRCIKIGSGIFNQRRVKKQSGFLRECSGRDGAGKGWQLPSACLPLPGGTRGHAAPQGPGPPTPATSNGCIVLPAGHCCRVGNAPWPGAPARRTVSPPPSAPSPTALGQQVGGGGLQGTVPAARLQRWVQRVQEVVQGEEQGAKGAWRVQRVHWGGCAWRGGGLHRGRKGAAGTGAGWVWVAW